MAVEVAFPFLWPTYLGSALAYHPILIQTSQLLGPPGVSALVLVGTLGLEAVLIAIWTRTVAPLGPSVRYAAILAVVTCFSWVRLRSIEEEDASLPRVPVGVIQANLDPHSPKPNANFSVLAHLNLDQELRSKRRALLTVWSESADTTATLHGQAAPRFRHVLGGHLGGSTILGAPVRADSVHTDYTNSAFLVNSSGAILGRYDKRRLVPFGEYVPFQEVAPFLAAYLEGKR